VIHVETAVKDKLNALSKLTGKPAYEIATTVLGEYTSAQMWKYLEKELLK